jgi:hypothetical protein
VDVVRGELFGLATSVGPVPFTDVPEAVDFARRAHERFPTVPVLARPSASLLGQVVDGIAGVSLDPDGPTTGALVVDPGSFDPGSFDPGSFDSGSVGSGSVDPDGGVLEAFLSSGASNVTAVRVPVLGPVTTALSLRTAGVEQSAAVSLATRAVAARAVAISERIARAWPDVPQVVVLSEPGLVGSLHPTFPFGRDQVRSALLDPVVDALDRGPLRAGTPPRPAAGTSDTGVAHRIGLHVPGRTDWDTLVGSGVSFVSLPADPTVGPWAGPLGRLVAAGGLIAWGAVPVDRPLGTRSDSLWQRLTAAFALLSADGVDPMELRLHSLVSATDGLAHFDPPGAGRVVDLCTDLSSRLRRQSMAARLSLGA